MFFARSTPTRVSFIFDLSPFVDWNLLKLQSGTRCRRVGRGPSHCSLEIYRLPMSGRSWPIAHEPRLSNEPRRLTHHSARLTDFVGAQRERWRGTPRW